ncbi:hypothetical protein AB0J35_62435 [Nonomuraea angiospora]|uniref:hypothetical protein n=1 Tax=Nonomuraea angiospora TaxID=46172 RepID=UPI003434323C
MPNQEARPTIHIPGTTLHTIAPRGGRHSQEGTLRHLKAGTGAPLMLLHTARTQAEHFEAAVTSENGPALFREPVEPQQETDPRKGVSHGHRANT